MHKTIKKKQKKRERSLKARRRRQCSGWNIKKIASKREKIAWKILDFLHKKFLVHFPHNKLNNFPSALVSYLSHAELSAACVKNCRIKLL
jgi:hypothetical protein